MRAVLVGPSKEMLAERHRLGHDRWDEVWDGVLHMVPPPSELHQRIGTDLVVVLHPLARQRGLVLSYETGLLRPGSGYEDYRQPDIIVTRPEVRTERGVEGPAELLVEILSPDDESHDKLPFYESMGVKEVLLLDPQPRTVELYVLRGGRLRLVQPDAAGRVRSEALGVSFHTASGPRLHLAWDGDHTEI